MADAWLYNQDTYVLLEPNQPEQFLTTPELLDKLKTVLVQHQDRLPPYLQELATVDVQAQCLLDTACDLDIGPGQFFQWYAVRLEK